MSNEKQEIDSVNFGGEQYLLTDLTPRVMDTLNLLIKLQSQIGEIALGITNITAADTNITII